MSIGGKSAYEAGVIYPKRRFNITFRKSKSVNSNSNSRKILIKIYFFGPVPNPVTNWWPLLISIILIASFLCGSLFHSIANLPSPFGILLLNQQEEWSSYLGRFAEA